MITWTERAKQHFSQKRDDGTTETVETPRNFSQERQKRTTETTRTPLSTVSVVHSPAFCKKHTFPDQGEQPNANPDPTSETIRPEGLPDVLLAASLALDAEIQAIDLLRGYRLKRAPEPAPEDVPNLDHPTSAGEPTPQKAPPWHHVDAEWRESSGVYLAHHATCKTCQSAGQGRGTRCTTGESLWANCQNQS